MASSISSLGTRFLLLYVTTVAWALWVGATVATFVFGWHYFHALPRPVAGDSANAMFEIFAKYELVLAAVAVAGAGLLMVTYPSKRLVLLVAGLTIAAGMMITVTLGLMPRMEILRKHGDGQSAEFRKLHGASMIAMTFQAATLLLTGAVLVAAGDTAPKAIAADPDGRFEPVFPKRAGLSTRL